MQKRKIVYSKGFPLDFQSYEKIKPPRTGGNTLHHFGEIIFVAFTCILCGVKSYDLMQEFYEIRLKWFHKWIALPNGVPCDNTFARVFEANDPDVFSQCTIHHLEHAGVILTDHQIAIDGKALRGSRSGNESHIQGAVITIDAMGTQREIAGNIIKQAPTTAGESAPAVSRKNKSGPPKTKPTSSNASP